MTTQSILTRDTLVPAGAVVAFLAGALWISNSLSALDKSITSLGFDVRAVAGRVESIETKLDGGIYLERREFQNWAAQLRLANPTLAVPDVR